MDYDRFWVELFFHFDRRWRRWIQFLWKCMFERVSLESLKYRNSEPSGNEADICALNSKQSEKTCQNRVKIGSKLSQNWVKIGSNSGQIPVKLRSESGNFRWNSGKIRVIFGRVQVKSGSKPGQNRVKTGSNLGSISSEKSFQNWGQ